MSYHGRYEQKKPPKKKKGLKILLIVLAVLLALILIAAGVVYWYIQSKFKKMNVVTLPENTYSYTEPAQTETRPQETEATKTVETTEETTVVTEPPKMKAEDIINILVVGQAAREGEESHLADSTMLISINTFTSEVTAFSVLRDAFVRPPAYRDTAGRNHDFGRIKFTTVYNVGYGFAGGVVDAMALTNATMFENFGVEVDYNVEVSFDSFIRMIDFLGGVKIELTEEEADYLNKDTLYVKREIQPGEQRLMGMEALSYARMRKAKGDADSDIKRTARQRKVVEALLKKVSKMSLKELNHWLDILMPMVTTTIQPSDVPKLVAKIAPILPNLTMKGETIPISGTGKGDMVDIYKRGIEESVMWFEAPQQKKLIRAITEAEIAD